MSDPLYEIRARQKQAAEYWRNQVRKLRPQGLTMAAKVSATTDVPWLLAELERVTKELDEAQAHAFVELEADIRRRAKRTDAEQEVIWAATKLVNRMKGAVGDSTLAAQQWLDPDSYRLFAAVDALDALPAAEEQAAGGRGEGEEETAPFPADAHPTVQAMLRRYLSASNEFLGAGFKHTDDVVKHRLWEESTLAGMCAYLLHWLNGVDRVAARLVVQDLEQFDLSGEDLAMWVDFQLLDANEASGAGQAGEEVAEQ